MNNTKIKQFELPKEFAEKWITALRSNKYKQGKGLLMTEEEDEIDENKVNCTYCCLGVAGKICNLSDKLLFNRELLTDIGNQYIPEEICNDIDDSILVRILTTMNDGLTKIFFDRYKTLIDTFIFKIDLDEYFKSQPERAVYFTFSEIADFIEDNVEFY